MTKNELLERIQFLEKENKELKDLLAKAGVQTEEKMQSETDASPTPFLPVIDRQMARVFFSYFWGGRMCLPGDLSASVPGKRGIRHNVLTYGPVVSVQKWKTTSTPVRNVLTESTRR